MILDPNYKETTADIILKLVLTGLLIGGHILLNAYYNSPPDEKVIAGFIQDKWSDPKKK